MIQVFCSKRGSGKTKKLIDLANSQLEKAKGNSVYIDDDTSYITQIDSRIRFIATNDFEINDYKAFYGLLCGIISEDYDIENIYIDGEFSINSSTNNEASFWLKKIDELSSKFNINIYMNVHYEKKDIPEFIKEFVA
ncbi:MAG: hypothetical protein PUE01_12375 [Clostridiaceae bacterium]|nr:hypothetical protein [Clostridiaceae bacterium]